MITLITKNGARMGNAIIYGGCETVAHLGGTEVFKVETDFGNRMKLTWREITEFWDVGRVQNYYQWRRERAQLINEIEEEPLP